jgi:hypothetical protein
MDRVKSLPHRERGGLREFTQLKTVKRVLTFQGRKPLGGGLGVAALWIDLDENQVIRRRVVRKDTHFRDSEIGDSTKWQGDPKALQGLVPLEWYCHRKVHDCDDARNVVEPLAWELDLPKLLYRL